MHLFIVHYFWPGFPHCYVLGLVAMWSQGDFDWWTDKGSSSFDPGFS